MPLSSRPTPGKNPAGSPARRPSAFEHPNLPLLLLQVRERLLARFRPILNAQGVTEQQWRIMRALHDTGPLEPREIVILCGISSPSLAGVLARMDELGLVGRERFEHDQRRLLVSLTAKSRGLLVRIAPRIDAAYAEIEARVGKQRMEEVYRMLDELIATLSDEAAAPLDE